MAGLAWNQWQLYRGTGGSLRVESVAALPWNQWQLSRGIRNPEHRLVARQLARDWEVKLTAQQQLYEEYHRFMQEQPRVLSSAEREAISALAHDLPALWHAPTTTRADRKDILRQIIHRVIVAGEGVSERLQITIEWIGGDTTAGSTTRPINRIDHLSYYPQLCDRIRTLAQEADFSDT